MTAPKDFREMTANSVGKNILQALVTEIKLLPDPWQKMSEAKQNDVIERLRARVETNVKMAVHLIASEGRTVVAGDLDQITIKDGVKAVVKFGSRAENLHELYDVAGKAVLVVVANAADHTQGMDEITGESDQRSMDLGHEYDPKATAKEWAAQLLKAKRAACHHPAMSRQAMKSCKSTSRLATRQQKKARRKATARLCAAPSSLSGFAASVRGTKRSKQHEHRPQGVS